MHEIRHESVLSDRTIILSGGVPGGNEVLIGIRDPGEANALVPVLTKLQKDFRLVIFTDGRGRDVLENSALQLKKSAIFNPLLWIAKMSKRPKVILTGTSSSNLGIEAALISNKKANIPVVIVEDYPGASLQTIRRIKQMPYGIRPDYLCVASESSKVAELSYMPDLDPDRVIVTGLPAFDSIASEDREGTRESVRSSLGLKSEKLVVWMGQTKEATLLAFQVLVKSLNQVGGNYALAVRRHPRDTESDQSYSEIESTISEKIVDTKSMTTDEIAKSADLIITMYSTEGLKAVYRGIPSIHILIPDILLKSEEEGILPPMPWLTDGSTTSVYKGEDLSKALYDLLYNEESKKILKKKMDRWKTDGKATKRVVELIQKVLLKSS